MSKSLGKGIKLFKDGRPEQKLEPTFTKSYETGLIQSRYKKFPDLFQ